VLTADLRAQFEGERWFGGDAAGLEHATVEVERTLPTDPVVVQSLVHVGEQRYQLLLDADGVDATADAKCALGLLEHVLPGQDAASARALGVEQSNTSVVFDERLLLKIFRRVPDGPNRDAEVPAALSRVGFDHVPPILGRWQEDGHDFAIVQPFLAGATDGWALALVSLRQLFDEGTAPEDAGGDFGPEARRLGEVTAQLHLALADAFGTSPAEPRAWSTRLADGLRAAVLDRLADAGRIMTVHGDYHLGQLLRTDTAWFVFDFEGEPARRDDERHERTSPLKDVAGMLRSFDYAAAVAAREAERGADDALARHWEQRNRQAFLDGYWPLITGSGLVPEDPTARHELLDAFELDKALYEVRYEEAHRPSWAEIPKAAVARLLAA
jgi:maltokinase